MLGWFHCHLEEYCPNTQTLSTTSENERGQLFLTVDVPMVETSEKGGQTVQMSDDEQLHYTYIKEEVETGRTVTWSVIGPLGDDDCE